MVYSKKVRVFFEKYCEERKRNTWEYMIGYLCMPPSLPNSYRAEKEMIDGLAKNNALFDLEKELRILQTTLVQVVDGFTGEGKVLLEKVKYGESHFCGKDILGFELTE